MVHSKARRVLVLEVTDFLGEHDFAAALVGKDQLEGAVIAFGEDGLRNRHNRRDARTRGDCHQVWIINLGNFLADDLRVVQAREVGLGHERALRVHHVNLRARF